MREFITETPVASFIFAITIATSIYAFNNPSVFGKTMLHPYSVARGKNFSTLITSGFVHKDYTHLIFNMLTFFFFGFSLEKWMSTFSSWGHIQFAALYIMGLVLSDLPTVQKNKDNYGYHSLGASGAICAVLFSAILFQPKMMLGLFFIIPIPAWLFGILFLVYCSWAAKQSPNGINHDAHYYGALVGLAVTIIMYPNIIPAVIQQFT